MCLLVFGMGFHVILCIFPLFFKTILALGGGLQLATDTVNNSVIGLIAPLMIVYILCDVGVSIAWYYSVLKKEWRLSRWAGSAARFLPL